MCYINRVYRCGHFLRHYHSRTCKCTLNNYGEQRTPKYCNQWFCNKKPFYNDGFSDHHHHHSRRGQGITPYTYNPFTPIARPFATTTNASRTRASRLARRAGTVFPTAATAFGNSPLIDAYAGDNGPITPPGRFGIDASDWTVNADFPFARRGDDNDDNDIGEITSNVESLLDRLVDLRGDAETLRRSGWLDPVPPGGNMTGIPWGAVPRTFQRRGATSGASTSRPRAIARARNSNTSVNAESGTFPLVGNRQGRRFEALVDVELDRVMHALMDEMEIDATAPA